MTEGTYTLLLELREPVAVEVGALGHADVVIRGDVRSTDVDGECTISGALPDGPIDGFGATDCACRSHLSYDADGRTLQRTVADAHRCVDQW